MPELPDVESVARALRTRIVGKRITRVRVLDPAVVRTPGPARLVRQLRGRVVLGVRRRGKYLLVRLTGGFTLVGHLRMTGDFSVVSTRAPVHPHTRLVVGFAGTDLRFVDQRRFGHVDLVRPRRLDDFAPLRRLGVEPLAAAFTVDRLRGLLRGRRGAVKALLLRQDLVAGIGNLYADEILFQARLRPDRRAGALGGPEVQRLHRAIKAALRRGVAARSARGRAEGDLLAVRARGGACPRCRLALRAAVIAGRTAYFCSRCQR